VIRSEFDLIEHALRGPLNVALLNVELVAGAVKDDPSATASLRKVRDEILRLSQSLIPAGFRILALEPVAPRPVALRHVIERVLKEQSLDTVEIAGDDWPTVVCDEALIAVAAGALARNAASATAPGGRSPQIRTEVRTDGGVDLIVQDWGTGFGDGRKESRSHLSRRGHLGGTTAVVRIARLHRAALAFESPGVGALVRFSFPAP
jgi:signal transduction histidine kinase